MQVGHHLTRHLISLKITLAGLPTGLAISMTLFSLGNSFQTFDRVQRDRARFGLSATPASQQLRGRHVAVLALQDERRVHQIEGRQGKQHRQAVEVELVPLLSQHRVGVVGAAAELDQTKDDAFLKMP